jgi:hypothetical protein
MDTFEERRKHERHKPPRKLNAFAENQLSQVVDISADGIRLKGTFFEEITADYKLKLFTDDYKFLLTDIPVKVIWQKTNGVYLNHKKELGVQFNDLSDSQHSKIQLLLTPQIFWKSQLAKENLKTQNLTAY